MLKLCTLLIFINFFQNAAFSSEFLFSVLHPLVAEAIRVKNYHYKLTNYAN